MRITKSTWHQDQCDFDFCEKLYCTEHRLIFNACQTAESYNGALIISSECPKCAYETQMRRMQRYLDARRNHEPRKLASNG